MKLSNKKELTTKTMLYNKNKMKGKMKKEKVLKVEKGGCHLNGGDKYKIVRVRDILNPNEQETIQHLSRLKLYARNSAQRFYIQRSIDRIIEQAKQRYFEEENEKKKEKELI